MSDDAVLSSRISGPTGEAATRTQPVLAIVLVRGRLERPEWGTCAYRIPDEEIPVLADLLGKMWKYDPSERASTAELLEHNWFKDRDIPDAAFSNSLKDEDVVDWPLPEDTSVLWTLDGAAEEDIQ
ncbi:hypothetical protein DL769_004784 [Monosporascus sp. CRB-8-3]|nr:hypothetical protein DL769_004784 [Monosporascus sp. CRB-8-3]